MIEEIWKPIKNYEELYEVSNHGRVRGIDRIDPNGKFIKGVLRKFQEDKDGYYKVSLNKFGKKKYFRINRLVAENFLENPNDLPVVNHIDGNKKNNYVDNLEWCTRSENDLHAFRTGLRIPCNGGTNKKIAKVSLETGEILDTYDSITEATKKNGFKHMQNISYCANGKNKKAYGYNWIFIDEGVTTIENTLNNN